MSERSYIRVEQTHELYDTYQQLNNNQNPTNSANISYNYDANTRISTIRCFWQNLVSSIAGANLVNIKVFSWRSNREHVVQDSLKDGRPVTIENLVTFTLLYWRNDPDDFEIFMTFEYVMNNSEVLPVCICNV